MYSPCAASSLPIWAMSSLAEVGVDHRGAPLGLVVRAMDGSVGGSARAEQPS